MGTFVDGQYYTNEELREVDGELVPTAAALKRKLAIYGQTPGKEKTSAKPKQREPVENKQDDEKPSQDKRRSFSRVTDSESPDSK